MSFAAFCLTRFQLHASLSELPKHNIPRPICFCCFFSFFFGREFFLPVSVCLVRLRRYNWLATRKKILVFLRQSYRTTLGQRKVCNVCAIRICALKLHGKSITQNENDCATEQTQKWWRSTTKMVARTSWIESTPDIQWSCGASEKSNLRREPESKRKTRLKGNHHAESWIYALYGQTGKLTETNKSFNENGIPFVAHSAWLTVRTTNNAAVYGQNTAEWAESCNSNG